MKIRTATKNDRKEIIKIYNHAVEEKYCTADMEYVSIDSKKE